MAEENGYRVVISEYKDEKYRHEIGMNQNLKMAKQVEQGANINLNHDEFFTFIEHVENGKVIDVIEEDY